VKRINRFKLHSPTGEDATKCRLMADGVSTNRMISGIKMVDQFELPGGFLLVTDFNDPWEESTQLTLLDEQFKPLARKSLGLDGYVFMRRPFSTTTIEILNDRELLLKSLSEDEGQYHVEIRETGIPIFKSRIKAQWLSGKPEALKT
jgi:hypothetical protein